MTLITEVWTNDGTQLHRWESTDHGWETPEAAYRHWAEKMNRKLISPGVYRSERVGQGGYTLTYFEDAA